ncbi:MAG TPA: site-2 protease family protein [Actinomycetota bacterium]|nr:site-2 protease family protein [Actinomycetota bacterium]
MFGRSIKIGSVGGIPITVDASWFLLAAFIVYSQLALYADAIGTTTAIAIGLLTALLFLGSILGHELAHAGVARLRKLPVTGIRLFALGGSTGIQMETTPADEFFTTVVGPLTSILIGFALVGATVFDFSPAVLDTLRWVGWLNVILGVGNLVPGFPLDGGRILHALIWQVTGNERKANSYAARSGMAVWAIGAALGLYLVANNSFGWGIWLMLISVMMFQGAKATLDRERIFSSLSQGTVNDAMGPPPETIPEDISLSEALDRYLRGHESETFPVSNAFQPVAGVLTFDAAARVGSENPLRPVRDAMLPPSGVLQVGLHDKLDAVASRLAAARLPAVVLDGGRIVGQIALPDIDRWLQGRRVR